jgi:hypothetical protein
MLVSGWGCESNARSPAADAGVEAVPPDAHAEEACTAPTGSGPFDFFGELCIEAPYPAVTSCHDDAHPGWCISGVCRPACKGFGCRRCDAGSYRITDRGACYCSPD